MSMRLVWWIVIFTKLKVYSFAVNCVCGGVGCFLDKDLLLFHLTGWAGVLVGGIYMGIRTFGDIDFAHPLLTAIIAIIIHCLISILEFFFAPILYHGMTEDAGENDEKNNTDHGAEILEFSSRYKADEDEKSMDGAESFEKGE